MMTGRSHAEKLDRNTGTLTLCLSSRRKAGNIPIDAEVVLLGHSIVIFMGKKVGGI